MSASIDNLINVNFTKGRNDLLNFGLKLGGRGDHNPYISPLNRLIILLFSNNEQGAFYIPRPVVNGTQSLFQDAAGTTPVTADGDPVGLMIDQSGNGNHATQSVSGRRLVYIKDGSLDLIRSDGVDDSLQTIYAAAVTPPCVLSIALNKLDSGTGVTLSGLNRNTRHQIGYNSQDGGFYGLSGSEPIISGGLVAEGKRILTLVINGENSSLRVDGVAVASGTLDNRAAATGLTISSLYVDGFSVSQDVYGIVHVEGISKVDDIESYLAFLAGVTL